MADIKQNKSLLQEFADLLELIPDEIIKAITKESEDEDHKTVINAYAPTLTNQFKELSIHLHQLSIDASKQKLFEAENLLKMTSGVSLIQNLKLALPSVGSILGKLGIKGIIQEIKKILTFLLNIFFKNLPSWVSELMLIINQILDHIFGGSSIKLMTALSQKEQNYLAELTQFAKLQKARKELNNDEDNDDL